MGYRDDREEEENIPLRAGSDDDGHEQFVVHAPRPRSKSPTLSLHTLFQKRNWLLLCVSAIAIMSTTMLLAGKRFPSLIGNKAYHDLVTVPKFEKSDPNESFNYRWYTEAKLRWLTACLARDDCPENADKVIIVNTYHCQWALDDEYHGGEGVWCLGLIRSWERQGYTVLHGGDVDWRFVYNIYRQIPDLVKVILSDDGNDDRNGNWKKYTKTLERKDGIPVWKYFGVSYYMTGSQTQVGHAWIVTCENDPPEQHHIEVHNGVAWLYTGDEDLQVRATPDHSRFTWLGYPLHPSPEETQITPWHERKNRVWVMTKEAHLFHNGHQQVYNLSFFTDAHNELSKEFEGFEFVGGWQDHRNDEEKAANPIPKEVKNFGRLNATEFDKEYSVSRMMLGVGSPPLSPSPYRAMSRAVPFGHPHRLRDDLKPEDDPQDDRNWGYRQHEGMQRVPEPYAYQIEAFNYTAFVGAIRKALSTPLEYPLRFERMRAERADKRLSDFVDADWHGYAEAILNRRIAGTDTGEEFVL
ncbi:uncharacterized protein LOC62_04G006454 [Vanrija pseudolonga]|uniref:Uncharacterized protein n=1 Tax=Vanrija pseudolonga TaxID=143232 RepID=A0AAF1BJ40_9TREE|nr:hypothetical protein LOC62_04G006454 [Vanrija pseudolonga]